MFKTKSTDTLKILKQQYDDAYYNKDGPEVEDSVYDALVDELRAREPKAQLGVGCKIADGDAKVKLPFFLGSMEKIKFEDSPKIFDWKGKHQATNYIISDKLNGISCLLEWNVSKGITLYTRGDGTEGRDISHFADKIKYIPSLKQNIFVRGEIIIAQKVYQEKYKKSFANALGLIVGTVNSKTIRQPIYDFDFVAYELISEKQTTAPLANLQKLASLGFKVVDYISVANDILTGDYLAKILSENRAHHEYEIDGLIVQSNVPYERSNTTPDGNPKYAFAFKMYNELAETTVIRVEWNKSKWKCLKPRIQLEPTVLGGSTVRFATGNNAKFISAHNIGPGARVIVTKSGDIIPKIVSVIQPAAEPDLPKNIAYKWNDTEVDIYECEQGEDKPNVPLIVHFFVTLGIKHVNKGVVSELVASGFDTLKKILAMSVEDFQTLPGFKEKLAEKIYSSIHSTLEATGSIPMSKLMVASGVFRKNFGISKAEALVAHMPDFLSNDKLTEQDLVAINGFGQGTCASIIECLPQFKAFLKDVLPAQAKPVTKILETTLAGKVFVFSKFRNASLKAQIEAKGGIVSDNITKKTTMLLISDEALNSPQTDKIKQAQEKNIPIVQVSKFTF